MAYTNTYQDLFSELAYHLMENMATPGTTDKFSPYGGRAQMSQTARHVEDVLRQRVGHFMVESTLAEVGSGVYTLPANCFDIYRVEVGGVAVKPLSKQIADAANSAWETDAGTCDGYIYSMQNPLQITLVPKLTGQTVKVLYSKGYAGAGNTYPGGGTTYPFPAIFRYVVKWGVLADLLSVSNVSKDPVRAASAQKMFEMGVTLLRAVYGRNPDNGG